MEIVCIFIPTTSVITNEFTKKVEREREEERIVFITKVLLCVVFKVLD